MTMFHQTPSATGQPIAPGRLADPDRVLKTDPRADPRMLAALAEFGFDEAPPPAPVTAESPLEEILEFLAASEAAYEDLFTAWFSGLPPIENVERRTELIKCVDDNDIRLYVHQPKNASGRLPCAYHIHGGAMVILEASGSTATRWRYDLPKSPPGGVRGHCSRHQGVRGLTVVELNVNPGTHCRNGGRSRRLSLIRNSSHS